MTPPTTPAPSIPAPVHGVVLDLDEAADLAGFLDGSGHGHLAAAGLITTVGHASIALHRRLRKANP